MCIVLDEMPEDPDPVAPGSQGTYCSTDAADDLIIDWDPSVNSQVQQVTRDLHLIPVVDRYHVLNSSSDTELETSFRWLHEKQEKVDEDACPRCGRLFDCKR